MATGALAAMQQPKLPGLRDQIRAQWGGYGDWKAADQDQVDDLARVLEANGIADLGKLEFRESVTKGGRKKGGFVTSGTGDASTEVWDPELDTGVDQADTSTVDVFYGGKRLGYLGDINRDGSVGKLAVDRLRADEEFKASKRGDPNEAYWLEHMTRENGGTTSRGDSGAPLLAWSARGGGNTSFQLVKDPKTGKFVVVPTWGSSSQGDKRAGITALTILAGGTAAGLSSASAAGAGAGATTGGATAGATTAATTGVNWGAVGSTALKSAGINAGVTLARGGDLGDALKAGALGAVTGGLGAGLSTGLGLNPAATNAITGGVGSALRGGDGKAILTGAASGALSGLGKTGITGNKLVDDAIVGGGSAAIRGGSGRDILTGALVGAGNGVAKDGGSSLVAGGQDVKLERGFFDDGGAGTINTGGEVNMLSDDMDPNFYEPAYGDTGGGALTYEQYADEALGGSDNQYLRDEPQADYENEGRNYPTPGSTQGDGGSPVNSTSDSSWLDSVPKWAKGLFGGVFGGGSGGGKDGGYMGGTFGRDLMMLLGAGIQGYGVDKMAREQREWQAKQEAEKRRRQMPVGALPTMLMTAQKGGQ